MQFAINILKALEGIRTPWLDTVIGLITRLGEELVVFGVICILFWCVNKNAAYKLGLVFFCSGIAVQGAKVTLCIDRPFVIDPSLKPVDSALEAATGYSFPSGHTQSATSLFGYLAIKLKSVWLKVLCVLAFALVAFSRMYLGVHTIYDVCVSMILSLIAAYLVIRFSDVLLARSNALKLCIVLGTVSVALCAYSFILSLGHCDPSQINDCFKTGGAGLAFAVAYYLDRRYIRYVPSYSGSLPFKILTVVIGAAVAIGLKSGIKLIAPGNLLIDFLRYFLTVFWVVAAYPFIIKEIGFKFKRPVQEEDC